MTNIVDFPGADLARLKMVYLKASPQQRIKFLRETAAEFQASDDQMKRYIGRQLAKLANAQETANA